MASFYCFRFVSGGVTINKPKNLFFIGTFLEDFELFKSPDDGLMYVIFDKKKKLYYKILKDGHHEGQLIDNVENLIRDFLIL